MPLNPGDPSRAASCVVPRYYEQGTVMPSDYPSLDTDTFSLALLRPSALSPPPFGRGLLLLVCRLRSPFVRPSKEGLSRVSRVSPLREPGFV